jgi:hypothetical protein
MIAKNPRKGIDVEELIPGPYFLVIKNKETKIQKSSFVGH